MQRHLRSGGSRLTCPAMKLRALFFVSLAATVSFGGPGPSLLAQYSNGGSTPAPAPAASAQKAADQPALTIPGLTIPRASGGFLGLQIDDNSNFKLSFYDAHKKPTAPDMASATLHWTPLGKKEIIFVSLTPASDGVSLTSERFIQKPWSFKLYISLFAQSTSSTAAENYIVDFSQ